jgi:hypothetical protein
VLLVGCSGATSEPEALPPQSVSQVTLEPHELEEVAEAQAAEARQEPSPPQAPEEAEAAPVDPAKRLEDDRSVIVIGDEEGGPAGRPRDLLEAAKEERERRQTGETAKIVITDDNLADFATGQLTVVESAPSETAAEGPSEEDLEEGGEERGEDYWRSRALELRLAWRDAAESIEELEGEVFQLRQRFYAEDDPFYRDGQIKPAWDHAIEELREAELEVVRRQEELEDFLEEGRRAGALPGWLREGLEFEPKEPEEPGDQIYEPTEPTVINEIGDGRR